MLRAGGPSKGIALLGTLLVLGLGGCAGGGGQPQQQEEADNEETDPDFLPEEVEEFACTGETGASLSSGSVQVTIPEGQISPCANAAPALTLTAADSGDLQDESETIISAGGQSAEVSLNSTQALTTLPAEDGGTTNDVTIVLPYDDSSVAVGQETSLHIYVLAKDTNLGTVVPLTGDLDPAANTITVRTKGLPASTVLTVVYNPSIASFASDTDSGALVVANRETKAATAATWPTNVWCVVYNPAEATLRQAVAAILAVAEDSLTSDQIRTVLSDRVARHARTSGEEYQALVFRAPHLYLQAPTAATRTCSGTDQPVYFVHMTRRGGSYFQSDDPAENQDLDTLAGFGDKFGRLYVSASRLDDAAGGGGLGTVESSIAHEMFHAIQAGHELYESRNVVGITEGSAATIGITLDGDGTRESTARVRSFANETFSLTNFLFNNRRGIRYSNQDFFAYVARRYNGGSLDFLPEFFEAIRSRIDAAETDFLVAYPPWSLYYDAFETALQDGISSALILPEVYFDFAANRLVEHNTESQFGRTGEIDNPGVLAEGLLRGNGLLNGFSGDPDPDAWLAKTKTSNVMGPYSTRVFKVTPTLASDNENGVKLTVTVTPSAGVITYDFKVKYYRGGIGTGTETTSESFEVRNWAMTTDDEIIVVAANTSSNKGVTFTYRAETEAEEEEEEAARVTGSLYRLATQLKSCIQNVESDCAGLNYGDGVPVTETAQADGDGGGWAECTPGEGSRPKLVMENYSLANCTGTLQGESGGSGYYRPYSGILTGRWYWYEEGMNESYSGPEDEVVVHHWFECSLTFDSIPQDFSEGSITVDCGAELSAQCLDARQVDMPEREYPYAMCYEGE